MAGVFLPLIDEFGDREMCAVFTPTALVDACVRVEEALARAQGDVGVIPERAAAAIAAGLADARIDARELWDAARIVGYPILPLVEQLARQVAPEGREYLHWGATTQDIMDTALVLQLRSAHERMVVLLERVGDATAVLAERHAGLVMAGRTHGQHAVPVTFGLKCSVWLAECARHHERLADVRARLLVAQLAGAAGTLASLGDEGAAVRRRMCARLGLAEPVAPWHTARDSLAEFAGVLGIVCATCRKIAREIADLSRTEIAEVSEPFATLRGASSTMPQKRNPIGAEVVIGLGALGTTLASAFPAAMQPGHERATGEWQIEWDAVPLVCAASAGAVRQLAELLDSLEAHGDAMTVNLGRGRGSIMSEAVMMRLAARIGRGRAHALVYDVAQRAHRTGVPLEVALRDERDVMDALDERELAAALDPAGYTGEALTTVERSLAAWRDRPARTGA